MRVAFHTLGCKVNMYETESMREDFLRAGFDSVSEKEAADVYVVNTCTVTALADRKSRQFIRRMKQKNHDAVIIVTGCYVQTSPDEVAAIEGVDIIAGTNEKENIAGYALDLLGRRGKTAGDPGSDAPGAEKHNAAEKHVLSYDELSDYHGSGIITSMESRTRAFIKIEEGCDRFCAYCVIPYARGPVRSRPMDEILAEAEVLVGKGFKELILTGINTALYSDLEGLLEKLDEMEGDFRVRLSSLEPTVINKDYVKRLFGFKRLCHHLHLSMQSGSDDVLRAMKRRYDMAEYMDIVDALKGFDPLYGISTDIIAGFPGETEEDHEKSLKAIRGAGLVRTHAFNYSRRPGTAAADMPDQISPTVKKRRVSELIAAGEEAAKEFAEKNTGKETIVIFEEHAGFVPSEADLPEAVGAENGGLMCGYTDNYLRAYAPYDEALLGGLTKVVIDKPFSDGVLCSIAEDA